MASPVVLCVTVLLQLFVLIYLGTSAEATNLKTVIRDPDEKPVESPTRDPMTINPTVAVGTQRPDKPSRSDLSGLGRYGPFVNPAFWRCMENPEECGIIIEEDE